MEPENQNHEARALVRADRDGLTLAQASKVLREEARSLLREQRHDTTTNRGVVTALDNAINGFLLDPDGEVIGRHEVDTVVRALRTQLLAIQAVQEEENPTDTLSILVSGKINMTPEERKMFLTAGTPDNMAKILQAVKKDGRIIELEQADDGTFGVVEHIDAIVAPLSNTKLDDKEATDAVSEELEMFGFADLMEVSPATEPRLRHTFQTVSIPGRDIEGAVIRVSKCTKCGITTRNTRTIENELCGSDG